LYWYNYEGVKEARSQPILPGETRIIWTFATHPWGATAVENEELSMLIDMETAFVTEISDHTRSVLISQ